MLPALMKVAGILAAAYFTLIGVQLVRHNRGKARIMPVITTLFWLTAFVFIAVGVIHFGL
jgi:hypothetical protein